MKRLVAEKTLEVDFFKGALQRIKDVARARVWRTGIYDHIRDVMLLQGGLGIERMCLLVGVSRAGCFTNIYGLKTLGTKKCMCDPRFSEFLWRTGGVMATDG